MAATSQLLCISAFFLAALILVIEAEDFSGYNWLVRTPPKNISCYECNNYSFNKTGDKNRYALLNRFCEESPERVKFYKKRCPDESQGCAIVKTDYSEFSPTQRNKRVFRVRRFCTKDLLPSCEMSESSRGSITLCTCESDFCNSASGVLPSALGLFAAITMAIRLV